MSLTVKVETLRTGDLIRLIDRLEDKILGNADGLARDMITNWNRYTTEGWPVDTGYSRSTIETPRKISDGHYQFRVTASYAGIIEYGGYRGVGPKTTLVGSQILPGGVQVGGGIFPSQRPVAPVRQGKSRIKLELAQSLAPKLLRASGFRGLGGGVR